MPPAISTQRAPGGDRAARARDSGDDGQRLRQARLYRKLSTALALEHRLADASAVGLDEGDLLYMPTALPGLSAAKASELLQQTNRMIKSVPEVARVFGKAGRADTATDPAPLEMFETTIRFKPKSEWRIGTEHEKFGYDLKTLQPLPYEGKPGIRAMLEGLERFGGWEAIKEGANIIGLKHTAGGAISLEPGTGRPRNPMINAGAIAAAGLVAGRTPQTRWRRMLEMFKKKDKPKAIAAPARRARRAAPSAAPRPTPRSSGCSATAASRRPRPMR